MGTCCTYDEDNGGTELCKERKRKGREEMKNGK
jgi:hypothetical protein